MPNEKTERSPWSPQLRTRALHPFLVLTLLGGLCLAACGGSSTSPTDTDDAPDSSTSLVYQAIKGRWTGSTGAFRWLAVEITRDSARSDERVGTLIERTGEDGDLRCRGALFAEAADPPRYWVNAPEVESGPAQDECAHPVIFRLDHDREEGTLTVFYRTEDESDFDQAGSLTREGG